MLPPKDNFAAWKNIGEGRKDETGEQGGEEESEDVWEEDRFSDSVVYCCRRPLPVVVFCS